MTTWKNKLLIIPPLIVAIGFVIFAQVLKKPINKVESGEKAVKVRMLELSKMTVQTTAFGYGSTEPGKTWDAVAELAGKIIWQSEQLEDGNIIKAGTQLLRLDDTSLQLSLKQIDAQIKTSQIKEKTIKSSIVIDKLNLQLLTKELKDKQSLSKRGAIAKSAVDDVQLLVYAAEAKVQNLHNAGAINNAERDVLKAQKAVVEYELSNTLIQAPFDIRITAVKSHVPQFVTKGQVLLTADGIKSAEINAQFSIGSLQPLIANAGAKNSAAQTASYQRTPGALTLDAIVHLKTATHAIEWQAVVDRVAGLVDLKTQSIGVIVRVDAPYQQAKPGHRPPLTRNTFVVVELRGKPQANQLVVPANAIHNNNLYLIDTDNRLIIRPVTISFSQSGYSVLSDGVTSGERIVVSDLIPAVEGMLLAPQEDKKIKKWLELQAAGKRSEQ